MALDLVQPPVSPAWVLENLRAVAGVGGAIVCAGVLVIALLALLGGGAGPRCAASMGPKRFALDNSPRLQSSPTACALTLGPSHSGPNQYMIVLSPPRDRPIQSTAPLENCHTGRRVCTKAPGASSQQARSPCRRRKAARCGILYCTGPRRDGYA